MQTPTPQDNTANEGLGDPPCTELASRDAAPNGRSLDDLAACERQIARLVEQLQRDNEIIARQMVDRQRRRMELLAAQENWLRARRK